MSKPAERYIKLYGGCYCTQLKITPSNWNDSKASSKKLMERDWVIWYRFYDFTVVDKNGKIKPKLIFREGMNKYRTLQERREITKELMADELDLLQKEGFNPITETIMLEPKRENDYEIDPSVPFFETLPIVNAALLSGSWLCRTADRMTICSARVFAPRRHQ